LRKGAIEKQRLAELRERIDQVAAKYPNIFFVSFADSLLLKSNWHVGQYDSPVKYTYEPEPFIIAIADLRRVYHDVFGMAIYAVLTQGSNEYYEDAVFNISESGNHISLNSLGAPFAQLRALEDAARQAIRN